MTMAPHSKANLADLVGSELEKDGLEIYGTVLTSRLFLGTARYPSPACLGEAVRVSGAQAVTVSLRREATGLGVKRAGQDFWALVRSFGAHVLPNTSGCRTAREAVTTARMARDLLGTPWIKLEVIGDEDSLHPDVIGLLEAARELAADGFQVFPYTTSDLGIAERLLQAGCRVLMPWGAPIGSGQGLNDPMALKRLRESFPDVPLVVDAGLGLPSQAARALEMGYDAVLLNTAVSRAGDPVLMARAFADGVEAGRKAYKAQPIGAHEGALPSSPLAGRAKLGGAS